MLLLHEKSEAGHVELYQAGIQQAALLHPPRHGLCCKVGHSGKRGGGDKRERSREYCATAQALHILPHLHFRLHLSSLRALSLDKKQIKISLFRLQGVKVSNSFSITKNTDMSVFIFAFLKPKYLCIRE